MDPLAVTTAGTVLIGTVMAVGLHRRVQRVEAHAAELRRQLQAERHLATHDALTGLPNRRAFFQLGEQLITATGRDPLVAVVVDLNDFKQINDHLGHAAGDEVLAIVAGRLAELAGDNHVARLGGDEFAGLFAVATADTTTLRELGDRLAETLGAAMWVAGRPLRITVSVGVTAIPAGAALSDVLRHADTAMYDVKNRRRNCGRVTRPEARPDWSTTVMPTPTMHPHRRDPAAVAPANSYRHADPVWVYQADSWRAGRVEASSPHAVTVTYRPANSRGTGVDTLTAAYLLPREDTDPMLDHTLPRRETGPSQA